MDVKYSCFTGEINLYKSIYIVESGIKHHQTNKQTQKSETLDDSNLNMIISW
jgi:hypothetical protein